MRSLSRVIVLPLHENCILIHLFGIFFIFCEKINKSKFCSSLFILLFFFLFCGENNFSVLRKLYLVISHVNRRNNERSNRLLLQFANETKLSVSIEYDRKLKSLLFLKKKKTKFIFFWLIVQFPKFGVENENIFWEIRKMRLERKSEEMFKASRRMKVIVSQLEIHQQVPTRIAQF